MADFATIVLGADTTGLKKGVSALDQVTEKGAKAEQATDGVSGGFRRVTVTGSEAARAMSTTTNSMAAMRAGALRAAGALGMIVGAAVSFTAGIHVIAEFDKSMAAVKAITNATSGEMVQLRAVAKDLGISTQFSASQAADGLKYLGMAGFSASQSIAAIPAVLDLATAAQMDLARAADISSNIMSGFGISATHASEVADVLALAASSANTDVGQLGDAMKYVAPVASALGMSMEDTAAAVGTMSNAGLQGSLAGTGLKTVLAQLAKATPVATATLKSMGLSINDVNPATHSLTQIVDTLRKNGLSAAAAIKIFGTEGAPAILALTKMAPDLQTLTDKLNNAGGAASRMAKTMRDQLGGDILGLQSAVQGLAITLGDAGVTAVLRGMVQAITAVVRGISDFIDIVSTAASWLLEVTGISAAVSAAVTTLGTVFGDARGYVIAAAAGLTLYYTPAIIAATIQTGLFIAGLITLRGALIATGIGALVVLAGTLINAMLKLVQATGGWGNALTFLGELAKAVWKGIVSSAEVVPLGLSAIWNKVAAGFYGLIGKIQGAWYRFLVGMSQSALANGMEDTARSIAAVATTAGNAWDETRAAAEGASLAADTMGTLASGKLTDSFAGVRDVLAQLNGSIDATTTKLGDGKADAGLPAALDMTGAAAKKAAAELKKLKTFADGWKDKLDPARKYREEMTKLAAATKAGYLSTAEYAKAAKEVGANLADSLPLVGDFVDAITNGLGNGFKNTLSDMGAALKKWIIEAIAMAAKNKIVMSLGLTGSVAGTAGQAIAGVAGGGASGVGGLASTAGSLGSLGSIGGIGSALFGGFTNTLGAFSSGLGTGFTAIGGQLSAAMTGSMSAVAGAIGAVAVPLLAVAAVFSFFKTKTKLLDSGIRVTVDNMDTLVQTFNKVQKTKFWGLSKKVRTSYSNAPDELANPLVKAVGAIQDGILSAADTIGIGADAFTSFSHIIKVSTKGLSEDKAKQKILDALGSVGDAFAGMVPGLEALQKDGEGARDALMRLVGSLTTVNSWMGNLGLTAYNMSLAGSAAASAFVDLFGSLDNFNSVAGSYYQNFYSGAERTARATQLLTQELAALGINTLPSTRAQFRALVDQADALGNTELVASLMQLSPAFAEITAASDSLGQSLKDIVNQDLFATGQDYKRGLSRASNNVSYVPLKSDAELLAEVRGMNGNLRTLISSAEITAGNTGKAANAAEDQLAVTLGATV